MESLDEKKSIFTQGNSDLSDNMKKLEIEVTDIIRTMGAPVKTLGYHYLREAIVLSVSNIFILNSVTKNLYPIIADKYSTTPFRVERAMRHTIEVTWEKGDRDALMQYFEYAINNKCGRPSNSEFIAVISDTLRLKMRK